MLSGKYGAAGTGQIVCHEQSQGCPDGIVGVDGKGLVCNSVKLWKGVKGHKKLQIFKQWSDR